MVDRQLRCAVLLGVLGLAAVSAPLRADSAQDYSLVICESQALAQTPSNNYLTTLSAMTGNAQLAMQRSMPVFVLTNTGTGSAADSSIASFEFTIGNASDEFEWAQSLKTSASTVHIDSITPSTSGPGASQILVTFSGFTPGSWVEFQAGIDPIADPHTTKPLDYRQVFFNNGTGVNSQATATYTGNAPAAVAVVPDQSLPISTSSCGIAQTYGNCGTSGIPTIPFIITPQVPEPSSVVLLALGALGLGGFSWRRRRRAA